jgi:hypothetical protein
VWYKIRGQVKGAGIINAMIRILPMVKNISLSIISLIIVLLASELFVRIQIIYTDKPVLGDSVILDDDLGWRTAENYRYEGWVKDASGDKYWVSSTTNEYGFRQYGNMNSNHIKVMIIGDSFTHAVDVSDGKTYYSIISDTLPLEVFAYGCMGFSTLQEYMIMNRYLETIEPDIIIIQFSSNDFIDNSYELDRQSIASLHATSRPYLIDENQILKLNPRSYPFIWETARQYSRLAYRLLLFFIRTRELLGLNSPSVESEIAANGADHSGFKKSMLTTDKVVSFMRKRDLKGKIFAFCADNKQPYYESLRKICKDNNISFIDGVPQVIRKAEEKGLQTRTYDRIHWNEIGHKICAEVIIDHLSQHIHGR